MYRSLRRRMIRAIKMSRASGYRGGDVAVAVVCQADTFADAPRWTPGADFRAVGGESPVSRCWERRNLDGTVTVVAAGVGSEPEVWTVTAAPEAFDGCGLGDSMHGITRMRDVPGAVVGREPYAGHPAESVARYWQAFHEQWGVWPRGEEREGAGWEFGPGRVWFYLDAQPESSGYLLRLVLKLCRSFDAAARVYPYNPRSGAYDGPCVHPDFARRPAG
ncbi:hypothetical protein ACIG3E_32580 [Streptomyces sp. NPDC053474]|uniref:hypothetical protein n=1 Tax=Streptomyces sp. NPDC053474 TaxID=3365704 RepID=UPI0037D03AB6